MLIHVCPECENDSFLIHESSVFCRKCGLVVKAPYSPDYVTDGYKKKKVNLIMVDIDTY